MKKRTNEEEIAILNDALETYFEAKRLDLEAGKKFRKLGIELCGPEYKTNMNTEHIHVFSGIKKLSSIVGVKIVPYLDKWGDKQDDRFMVEYNGCRLFQIADIKESVKKVKFR